MLVPPPPHEKHIKPIVLLLASFVNFGGCYCYDNPSALKSQLAQHFSSAVSKSDFEMYFNLLYSVYSVPNIVLPLFGGVLADKFGPRYVLVATTSLMFIGHVVFALGNSLRHLPMMLIGRVIFGLGGETVSVAQSALLALWFPASELAFANGVILSVMRLGTTVNNQVSPKVAEAASVATAVWIGAGVCLASVLAALLLLPIDAKAEQQIHDDVLTDQENQHEVQVKASIRLADAATFSWSFWLIAVLYVLLYAIVGPFTNIAAGIYMERDYFRAPPVECQRCGVGALLNDERCLLPSSTLERHPSLPNTCPPSPPFAFPLPLLSATCRPANPVDQFNCSTTPPYVDEIAINCDEIAWKEGPHSQAYCQAKSDAEVQAAVPLSFAPLVMAFLAPLFGYFIDHVGCRAVIATAAMAALAIGQGLLGFTHVSPFVPLSLQATAVCLFLSALWPAVSYCVEPHHVGTAYGILSASLNFGLAVVPMVVVVEYNAANHKYIPLVHELFIAFAIVGVCVGLALVWLDFRSGGVLHSATMTSYAPPQVMPQLDKVPLLHLPKPVKAYGTSAVS